MKRHVLAAAVVVFSGCVSLILSSTEEPIITRSMGNPAFGMVNVGTMSTPHMFEYTPQTVGSDDDTITDVTFDSGNCNDFALMGPPPIGPGPMPNHMGSTRVYEAMSGICDPSMTFQAGSAGNPMVCPFDFTAVFTPMSSGSVTCNVLITYHTTNNATDVHTVTLALTGTGVQPVGILASPPSVNFGNVPRNTSSSVTAITVKNTGMQTETVTGNNTNPGTFQTNPAIMAGHPLAPNAIDTYNTLCHPTTLGPLSATLSFHAMNGGFGSDTQSTLDCTGIDTFLSITPIPVTFATTLVGRAPPSKDVMITNTGAAATITVAPDQTALGNGVTLANNVNGPIAAGATVTPTLNYAAGAQHTGSLGFLVVTLSTDAMPFNVGLNGEADVGVIATNPVPIAFNTVCTGTATTQDIDIYASAPGDVTLVSASVTPSSMFTVTPVSGMALGNHGNDVMATVTATPTAAGVFPTGAKLTITTNIPNMTDQDVPITGTAMAGGVAVTPDVVHFGGVTPGLISSEMPVMVTNCGAGDLTISATSFSGITPTEFTIINPPPLPITIAKTQSQTLNVVMRPASAGPKSAMLVLDSNQGSMTALFDGTGTSGTEGGNKDRETYYACSVGGGAGAAWPIGFALLALRRRRRR